MRLVQGATASTPSVLQRCRSVSPTHTERSATNLNERTSRGTAVIRHVCNPYGDTRTDCARGDTRCGSTVQRRGDAAMKVWRGRRQATYGHRRHAGIPLWADPHDRNEEQLKAHGAFTRLELPTTCPSIPLDGRLHPNASSGIGLRAAEVSMQYNNLTEMPFRQSGLLQGRHMSHVRAPHVGERHRMCPVSGGQRPGPCIRP